MAVNEFGFVNAKLPSNFSEHHASSEPDPEANKPIQYIRLNKCHDFKETQDLWKNAANRTAKIGAMLVLVYTVLGYFMLAYLDGMRGIDCWYYLATTLTTVGLGDLYPSKQITRAFAIFMLPFGLIIISFGISLAAAQAEAMPSVLPSDLKITQTDEDKDTKSSTENKKLDESSSDSKFDASNNALAKFKSSRYWSLLNMLAKYFAIIFVGAFIMYLNHHERKKQDNALDEEFTFVDSLFFATVVATTVGYGHEITPLTDTTKGLMIPYMFYATFIVGGIIGDMSGLYLSYKEDYINDQMIESTTWVHRADLDKDGKVSEADFVLFKLQQMQKVDRDMMERLIQRYHDLDVDGEGALDIGIDVPSAEHVKEMQRVVKGTGLTLPQLWRQIQPEISAKAKAKAMIEEAQLEMQGIRKKSRTRSSSNPEYVKLSECHDFKWSKTLWKKAADETAILSILMLVFYIGLGSYLMAYMSGMAGVDAWYFLVATLTTVGYGDFAPEREITRGFAIVMIPFGLGILGFGLSYLIAYTNSKPYKQRRAGGVAMSKGVGGGGGGSRTVHSMLNRDDKKMLSHANSSIIEEDTETVEVEMSLVEPLGMGLGLKSLKVRDVISHSQAAHKHVMRNWRVLRVGTQEVVTFDEFHKVLSTLKLSGDKSVLILFDKTPRNKFEDYDGKDVLGALKLCFPHARDWLSSTVSGKFLTLLFKMFLIIFVGALFFKLHQPEVDRLELTWIDALYFGSVTATSIGYGDITAQSDGGKIFLCFYMLISTLWMADCLGDFIDLYVHDIVGEGIIDYIIDSTTWVHKCDLDGDGKVSEADYVLFKLQQMQKVDAGMMDILIDRYHELDVDGEGALDVGIDIPSAEQVKMMQEVIEKTNTPRSLVDLWKDMQESLQAQRGKPGGLTTMVSRETISMTNPMQRKSGIGQQVDFQHYLEEGAGASEVAADEEEGQAADRALLQASMSEAQRSKPSSIEMVDMGLN